MKRAIQANRLALLDVSSGFRHSFCRCRSGGAAKSRTKPKPENSGKGGKSGKGQSLHLRTLEAAKDAPVAQELRKILSPEACAWIEGKSQGAAKQLPSLVEDMRVRGQAAPSMEKLAFDAMEMEPEVDGFAEDADTLSDHGERLQAGTVVEVRRSELAMRGVVLYTVLLGRRWLVNTLMINGEVWQHHEHDVTFQIPDFVSKKEAERCGLWYIIQSEDEFAARVRVLNALRTLEKRLEYDCHLIPDIARNVSLYDLVAHPDPHTWTQVTVLEAAEKLLGKKSSALTKQDLFAVQTYLFDTGELFVASQRRFLQKPTFWVRPRQEVSDIKTVHRMVLNNEAALDSFVSKARKLVPEARTRSIDSWNELPSRQPLPGISWSSDEKALLRFLLVSLENRRIIQVDPYAVPLSHILKKLNILECDEYESRSAHHFLIELGMLAPWEDLEDRDILKDSTMTVDLTPTVSTPILPDPLGPTDLYSRDIVEHIRHDFGDTPVYVVDDWSAEELDDGVSVERIPSDPEHTWIHVHIADPTTVLPPTHQVARRAMTMITSRYYVNRTIPMLPYDATFHRYSLGNTAGEPNHTLTFSMKVDGAGDIVDYRIRPSIIRNVRIVRYDEVDKFMNYTPFKIFYPFGQPTFTSQHSSQAIIDPAMIEDFRLLEQVTGRLSRRRLDDGAFVFAFPAPELKINPRPLSSELMGTGEPSAFRGFPHVSYGVRLVDESGARFMIAECMKAAGCVASMFFRDRGIPALRRTVGPPRTERKDGLAAIKKTRSETGLIDPYEAIRAGLVAPSGSYVTTPGPHSLLGVPDGVGYMRVTSPLRRFGDMLAHWQIKHALLAERGDRVSPILFDEDWLVRFAEEMSVCELDVKRGESAQGQFWTHTFLLRWMHGPGRAQREEDDPLRMLKGRIVESPKKVIATQNFHVSVNVDILGLKGRMFVEAEQAQEMVIAQELDVKIDNVRLGSNPQLTLSLR